MVEGKDYTIEYTEDLPDGIGGKAFPPFPWLFGIGKIPIKLRPKYKNDSGILQHEIDHVRQYKTKWNHAPMYVLSKKYRYACELEAYEEQIKAYSYTELASAIWIVDALMTKYRLKLKRYQVLCDVEDLITKNKKK